MSKTLLRLKHAKLLYLLQEGLCLYCDVPLRPHRIQNNERPKLDARPAQWNIEHVIPKARGGSNSIMNKAATCFACNCAKGDAFPTAEQLERDVARVRYYTSLQLDALPPPANQTRWSIFGEYDRQHPILGIIDANGRKIVRIVATPDVALEEIRCALDMWVDVHNDVDATS